MEGASVDLGRLRDEAWKHFVRPEDRRVFAEDDTVVKVHPATKAQLGAYRVRGDRELAARPDVVARWGALPPLLTRDEWTAVLCTGRCGWHRSKKGLCGGNARCALGGAPLRLDGIDCVAEVLQLHPQAEGLLAPQRKPKEKTVACGDDGEQQCCAAAPDC